MILRPAALAAAILLCAATAGAQGMPDLLDEIGVTGTDYRMMRDAARELYGAEPIEVGAERSWRNGETGAGGTVELTGHDGTCVTILHRFRNGRSPDVQRYVARHCRTPDGEWHLAG